jgi:hypothetical protein
VRRAMVELDLVVLCELDDRSGLVAPHVHVLPRHCANFGG